jgi:hypothetical protein
MRLEFIALAAALFAGACSAEISGGSNSNLGGVGDDDTTGGTTGDPTGDPAPAPKCTSRTVYLNFEGQTLTQGTSDATTNHAGWMQIPQGTAPAYLAGNTNRDTTIKSITDGVRAQLSQFPITVVTTRPTSGKYMMIVFGGQAQQVGSLFGAVQKLDCGDQQPNDVAWISDGVSPVQRIVNSAIGSIGFGLGLTATLDPNDCMCAWDNGCKPNNNTACTLSSSINRDPAARQTCPGLTTQDEVATIHKAFCE